jgi:hypothetical protein
MAGRFTRAYVVLDALDECEDMPAYLLGLEDLRNSESHDGSLQILTLSRKESTIEQFVGPRASGQIHLSFRDTKDDLDDYIATQIEARVAAGKLKLRNPALKKEISNVLAENANGMSVSLSSV